MGGFNSDDHYIYYCGQDSLGRNGIAIIVKKEVQNAVLGCNLKTEWFLFVSKANHSVSWYWKSVPRPEINTEGADVELFCEDLQDLLELTHKKDVLFIIGDWNAKVGSQETSGITGNFGLRVQNEAGHRQIEFCQENTLVIANTLFQQPKRRLYTWTSPDDQHQNQIDYILAAKDGEALYSP